MSWGASRGSAGELTEAGSAPWFYDYVKMHPGIVYNQNDILKA